MEDFSCTWKVRQRTALRRNKNKFHASTSRWQLAGNVRSQSAVARRYLGNSVSLLIDRTPGARTAIGIPHACLSCRSEEGAKRRRRNIPTNICVFMTTLFHFESQGSNFYRWHRVEFYWSPLLTASVNSLFSLYLAEGRLQKYSSIKFGSDLTHWGRGF